MTALILTSTRFSKKSRQDTSVLREGIEAPGFLSKKPVLHPPSLECGRKSIRAKLQLIETTVDNTDVFIAGNPPAFRIHISNRHFIYHCVKQRVVSDEIPDGRHQFDRELVDVSLHIRGNWSNWRILCFNEIVFYVGSIIEPETLLINFSKLSTHLFRIVYRGCHVHLGETCRALLTALSQLVRLSNLQLDSVPGPSSGPKCRAGCDDGGADGSEKSHPVTIPTSGKHDYSAGQKAADDTARRSHKNISPDLRLHGGRLNVTATLVEWLLDHIGRPRSYQPVRKAETGRADRRYAAGYRLCRRHRAAAVDVRRA